MKALQADDILGSWRLLSHETQQSDSNWKSWGKSPRGILIYTAEGTMSVSLNKDPEGDPSVPKNTLEAILFYAGRFEINSKNQVLHIVELASDLQRVGKTLTRDAVLEGDVLTLSAQGSPGLARIRWQRVT